MNLCAAMICRNEVSRYLPLVIEHLRGFCDTMLVLDDASDDGTADWLFEQADEQLAVVRHEPAYHHQGRVRNHLLDLIFAAEPTHVLNIDCDEFVADGQALRKTIQAQPEVPVWSLDIAEVWNATPEALGLRVDGGWRVHPLPMLWRLSERRGPNWKMLDRARACRRYPVAVGQTRAVPSGATCLHVRWADKAERKAKFDWYMQHDGGRYHARSHLLSIAWPDSKIKFQQMPWPEGAVFDRLRERFAAVTA